MYLFAGILIYIYILNSNLIIIMSIITDMISQQSELMSTFKLNLHFFSRHSNHISRLTPFVS